MNGELELLVSHMNVISVNQRILSFDRSSACEDVDSLCFISTGHTINRTPIPDSLSILITVSISILDSIPHYLRKTHTIVRFGALPDGGAGVTSRRAAARAESINLPFVAYRARRAARLSPGSGLPPVSFTFTSVFVQIVIDTASRIGFESGVERRIKNESRIRIESDTGTEIENGNGVQNECEDEIEPKV
ncbi:hypothetical protein EVAR_74555_1 [Eumeta japonica]|uniref:Uncharacterized protein n=1 Tax=Eumeta variegata TaxID=151549 RepID=A0A4C1TF55_EUMVA|nr:hypothetical protein EVAR_74555_1 [Eumeta japonica]